MVQAIAWLHTNNWAHRDIKPHNFLVGLDPRRRVDGDPEGNFQPRIMLTDFGTAARGFEDDDGNSHGGHDIGYGKEHLSKRGKLRRKDCLWPVGTPDYIAPEVLEAHEDALVRAEEEEWDNLDQADDEDERRPGYGFEVDWWSLGVMI